MLGMWLRLSAGRLARVFLAILFVAILAHVLIIAASDTVWSPATPDTVTDGSAFLELMPAEATITGQVNVTVSIYNVQHLYGFQLAFTSSAAINTTATIVPTDNVFQNYDTIANLMGGFIVIPTPNGIAFANCLLGPVNGVSGNGVLMQIAFQVDSLPASFKIDAQNTMLVDDNAQLIAFTYAGG